MTESSGLVRPLEQPSGPAPPLKAAAARTPRRRVPRWVFYAAVAAAIAAAAVWLFVLRDTGNLFAGTWKATQAPIEQAVISGPGRHIRVMFSGRDSSGAAHTFTVTAHKDGPDLVVTVDDFAKATGDAAEAARVRNTFAAFVKDFRLVFTRRDATHLVLTVEGRLIGAITVSLGQRSIVLTKAE